MLDLDLPLEGIGPNNNNLPSDVAKSSVTVEVLSNITEKVTLTKTDKVVYDPSSGKFKRNVDLGNKLSPGEYEIKIKVDRYLKKLVPAIFTVKKTTEIQTIPIQIKTPLLRSVGVLDYNAVANCYGDKLNTVLCANRESADLNFDEIVDIIDLNIVLRNFGKKDD